MARTHTLKVWPNYFGAILLGVKTFEVRKNDRNFKQGDHLILKEWNPEKKRYTGGQTVKTVSYILPGGQFGIEKGYVVMALQ